MRKSPPFENELEQLYSSRLLSRTPYYYNHELYEANQNTISAYQYVIKELIEQGFGEKIQEIYSKYGIL